MLSNFVFIIFYCLLFKVVFIRWVFLIIGLLVFFTEEYVFIFILYFVIFLYVSLIVMFFFMIESDRKM